MDDDEPVHFDINDHRAFEDFKALLMWWNDRERAANGLPPLEVEIAAELRMCAQHRNAGSSMEQPPKAA